MLQDNQIILDVSQLPPEEREKLARYLQKLVELAILTGRAVPTQCNTCCQYSGGYVIPKVE
ncbi:MAG: hypothetical protein ABIK77_02550 [candidate division WOR-3 bacterium]